MAYAVNKKARHEYDILDTLEAGLVLTGPEVKAVRSGQMRLGGAYITFHKGEAYLTGSHIPRYQYTGASVPHDPERSRKLLLSRKQIDLLQGKAEEKGLTIVPLSVYNKGRHIKVEIAVGRGKKLHDKRRTIKERDQKRDARRILKGLM